MRYCDFINEARARNSSFNPSAVSLNPLTEFPFRGTREELRQCMAVLQWMLIGKSNTTFLKEHGVNWFERYVPGQDVCNDLSNVDHTAVFLTLGKVVTDFPNVPAIREEIEKLGLKWESFLQIQPDYLGVTDHVLYRIDHYGDQLEKLTSWLSKTNGGGCYVTGMTPRFAPVDRISRSTNYLDGKVNYVSPVTGFGVDSFVMTYNERIDFLSAYHKDPAILLLTEKELDEMSVPKIGFNLMVDIFAIEVGKDFNRIATIYSLLAIVLSDLANSAPIEVTFMIKKPVIDDYFDNKPEFKESESPVVRLKPGTKQTLESYAPEDFAVDNLRT